MSMTTHESMTEKRRAVGILDVSVEAEKIQAFGADNPKFRVFNVMDGDPSGNPNNLCPPDSIRRAFQFVESKMPSYAHWNKVKVGNAVHYTPSNDCPEGAKTMASQMSILKGTTKEERKQLYPALAAIDDRVNREVKAHIGDRFPFTTPFALLRTPKGTDVQRCHLDEKPLVIMTNEYTGYSAILAASQAGSYLLVFPDVPFRRFIRPWDRADRDPRVTRGRLVYIPFGWCVLFQQDVLRAGGFHSLDDVPDGHGNLRFFYYIVPQGAEAPIGNWDAFPSGRRFSEDFVNPLTVTQMERVFFYD